MTLSVRHHSSETTPARKGRFAHLDWVTPLTDVEETDDAYIVKLEMPGIKKRDVDISVAGRRLTVSAERRERAGILRRRVRSLHRFRYEVLLSGDVDGNGIDIHLDRGVLTVRVPKVASDRPNRIEVPTTS